MLSASSAAEEETQDLLFTSFRFKSDSEPPKCLIVPGICHVIDSKVGSIGIKLAVVSQLLSRNRLGS